MKTSPSFLKRYGWIMIAGLVVLIVIAWAAFLGYRNNQAKANAAIIAPPTVPVARGDVVLSVTAPGLSEDIGQVTLTSDIAGRVAGVNVRPGDVVKKGQVLVNLGPREAFEAALSQAKVDQIQAQQALDILIANAPVAAAQAQVSLVQTEKAVSDAQSQRAALNYPRATPLRLESLQADAAASLQAVTLAQTDFDRVANNPLSDPQRTDALHALVVAKLNTQNAQAALSYAQNMPTAADITQADVQLAQAQAQAAKAQRDWDALKDGPDKVQLELAQANLDNAQRNVAKAQTDLVGLDQAAPIDGVILSVACLPGQAVSPGSQLLTLTDPQAIEVRSTVIEQDLPLVQIGQPVQLYFDALPDATVTGKVARIVPQRDSTTQAIYPVYITLDAIPAHLVPGMTVDGSIVIASVSGVLRLPKSVVHAHDDGTAQVQVWQNGAVETRTIKVGLRGDSFVEILDGLSTGDLVVAQ